MTVKTAPLAAHYLASSGRTYTCDHADRHVGFFIPCQDCQPVSPMPLARPAFVVKIVPNDHGNPPGKLADVELHFTEGLLEGLKLIGFGVWERRGGSGRNVTFPARQYAVNGERRSFALLRPVSDITTQNRVREFILDAYAEFEQRQAESV